MGKRQEIAAAFAAEPELANMCAYVISPLPLRDGEALDFEVLATKRDAFMAWMSQRGWQPKLTRDATRILPVEPEQVKEGAKVILTVNRVAPQATLVFEVQLPADEKPYETRPGDSVVSDGKLREFRRKNGLRLA
jgi:hypothetical protein